MAPNGFLHAASVVALADTACGYGCVASLPQGASGFTTIELKTNFLGTARSEMVECEARLIHGGRNTQIWDAEVRAEGAERPMALFRCTPDGALPPRPDPPGAALRRYGLAKSANDPVADFFSRRYGSRPRDLTVREPAPKRREAPGEVVEWSIAPHSKCGVLARVPWVRIPPSPPARLAPATKSQETLQISHTRTPLLTMDCTPIRYFFAKPADIAPRTE